MHLLDRKKVETAAGIALPLVGSLWISVKQIDGQKIHRKVFYKLKEYFLQAEIFICAYKCAPQSPRIINFVWFILCYSV